MEQLVKIGYAQKPHGLNGEIKVFVEEMYEEDFDLCDTVFFNIKGKQLPYFVESIRIGNATIVKFEDVDSKEKAMEIQGKELSIRKVDILDADERTLPASENYTYLQGYLLLDEEIGQIAIIEEVIDMPQQEVAAVTYQEKEVLIPLHPSLIVNIDKDKKEILMNLPVGLLTL